MKKALFGLPSLMTVFFMSFFSYVYYFKFLPSLESGNWQIFFFILHSLLLQMSFWSFLKTLTSDPGYLPLEYHVSVFVTLR